MEIECLFTSEAEVVTEYDITAETEDINIDLSLDNLCENEDIIDKVVDIKQDLLQNRDCANLIPKVENIEDICREMLK